MEKKNLDFYVSYDPVNVYYLTNFANKVHERPFILIIPREGVPKMIVPLLEKSHVQARARCELEFIDYYEFPAPKGQNWFDIYEKQLDKHARVGVESAMPMGIAEKTIGKMIITDIIDEARIIKTDYEIGRTVHACKIINRGHKQLLKIITPESMEFAIFQEITSYMQKKIIKDLPEANFIITNLIAAVWPPSFSHDPHIVPNIFAKMEEGGPHVSIISAQIDGFGVEVERTFFLGNVPEKAKKPFEVMLQARELAYSMLKPGVIMSTIDKEVRKFITKEGYGDNIIHRTGHGLGITGHEAPFIAEGYDKKLTPNMVISIEPGIYIPGIGGFRHSDTVLIQQEGYQKLSKAPESLEDLII
ncbi:MAG: aminopeptidase P family protein [Promethearchaeota archaeon]|nr:MAG: aminopeptidase P family protein [Candidatus Lokiarchaeota archaeon]